MLWEATLTVNISSVRAVPTMNSAMMLGPVSSATPEGAPWLLIPGGFIVLVGGWYYYFKPGRTKEKSLYNMIVFSSVCLLMIGLGAWPLFH